MDILSCTNCPLDPATGSGKTVLTWSGGLRQLGHSVKLIQPEDFELQFGSGRLRKIRQAMGAASCLEKEVDRAMPDLIEFYGAEFWLATTQLAKRKHRPFLVAHTNGLELLLWSHSRQFNARSLWREALSKLTYERFEPLAFANTDAFVGLCELDRKFVVDNGFYPREKTHVIEPGLDREYLDQPQPITSNREQRVAFVGSWIPRKGSHFVPEVMTRVLRQRPACRFDIFGTSANQTILGSFPSDVRDRVTVHPTLPNPEIAAVLSRCQVFLFPTGYEGFGMALAEAMSCGCASITTPTGFGAELAPGEEALLCTFGNVGELEQSVLRLLDDEPLRSKLAVNGWKRTRGMDWDINVKRLSDVYENWLQEFRSTANKV